jgi:hypothetical protein
MHRIPQDRYTRHEVTASRAGSPSGRTAFGVQAWVSLEYRDFRCPRK